MSLLPTLSPDPSVVCPPCTRCCRYVAVPVDGPSSVPRVSTALWILYHRRLSIYQSHEGDWFLLVPGDCENLRPDGLCGIYESRPRICREYSVDGCEGTSDDPGERVRFDDARQLVEWLSERRPKLYARCLDAGIIPESYRPPSARLPARAAAATEEPTPRSPGGAGGGASPPNTEARPAR